MGKVHVHVHVGDGATENVANAQAIRDNLKQLQTKCGNLAQVRGLDRYASDYLASAMDKIQDAIVLVGKAKEKLRGEG